MDIISNVSGEESKKTSNLPKQASKFFHNAQETLDEATCQRSSIQNSSCARADSVDSGSLFSSLGPNNFVCHVCSKVFREKWLILRHLRSHTGEKPYSCKICKKGFRQKCHLKVHFITHTGEKPFSCMVCKKRFAQKSKLLRHITLHKIWIVLGLLKLKMNKDYINNMCWAGGCWCS